VQGKKDFSPYKFLISNSRKTFHEYTPRMTPQPFAGRWHCSCFFYSWFFTSNLFLKNYVIFIVNKKIVVPLQ